MIEQIAVKTEVIEQIKYLATYSEPSMDLGEIVERALRYYLRNMQRQKLDREQQAFERQKAVLLSRYPGEYIAMHEGKVIDRDMDLRLLNARIFERFGRATILYKKVTDEPERDIMFRSPRLEQE